MLREVLLKSARDNLKNFALNIKMASPDQQFALLKTYIRQIIKDPLNKGCKLTYVVLNPNSPQDNDTIIFEKVLYIE
jgi:hypothetical protein